VGSPNFLPLLLASSESSSNVSPFFIPSAYLQTGFSTSCFLYEFTIFSGALSLPTLL